jgi:2-polyprenyl-3-methyl-5-hydroxy-6-metoxy-1,4-benzoquinol methylase
VQTADPGAREIRERYQKLYGSGRLSLSRNYSDKFPLLDHLLKDLVRGRSVLDFGCGPGRLTLMVARYAREAHGVDFAGEGIELAGLLARAAGVTNARFFEGDLAWVSAQGRSYDAIVLAGVLEHLERALDQLEALGRLVTPGGLLCVQTPSFANFRGDVYNTLGNLLGLPMSLTDLWQVTPRVMQRAASRLGFRLENVVGGHYRLAFLERVLEDFRQRVPAAARDAGQGAGWSWERFFAWIAERTEQNRTLIDAWVVQGALKPVPKPPALAARRPDGVDDGVWTTLEQYLTYDGWREPWYSDVSPVRDYGASAVYFFRKTGDAR